MTKKAEVSVKSRAIRGHVFKLLQRLGKADPNCEAFAVATEMLETCETRLAMLLLKVENDEI